MKRSPAKKKRPRLAGKAPYFPVFTQADEDRVLESFKDFANFLGLPENDADRWASAELLYAAGYHACHLYEQGIDFPKSRGKR